MITTFRHHSTGDPTPLTAPADQAADRTHGIADHPAAERLGFPSGLPIVIGDRHTSDSDAGMQLATRRRKSSDDKDSTADSGKPAGSTTRGSSDAA